MTQQPDPSHASSAQPEQAAPGQPGADAPVGGEQLPGEPVAAEQVAGEPVAGAPYESPDEMEARIKELTTDLQRLQAEYVNYKRRVDRDRELVVQNAKVSVLTALLPVLDDVDRARKHGELTGGFKAVAESFERIVVTQGLTRFGAEGDEFDPRIHEALMHTVSAEVTSTQCDTIVQPGYRLGERLVRPARVTVVAPDPEAGQPPEPQAAGEGAAG